MTECMAKVSALLKGGFQSVTVLLSDVYGY